MHEYCLYVCMYVYVSFGSPGIGGMDSCKFGCLESNLGSLQETSALNY